jgi:hypothetical protein
MVDENTQIEIDPDVLRRCGSDLGQVAQQVKDVAADLGRSPLNAGAFGLMNAWMVPPISGLASHSTDLITVTGDVTAAVGGAALAAAQDFEETESAAIRAIDALAAKIVSGS